MGQKYQEGLETWIMTRMQTPGKFVINVSSWWNFSS